MADGVIATAAVQIRARDSRGQFKRDVRQMVDQATPPRVGEDAGRRIGGPMGRAAGDSFLNDFKQKLKQGGGKFSLPISTAVALSPALLPILAQATALAGGMAAAFATAGIAVGVFGAAAVPILKETFEQQKKVTDQQDKFNIAAVDTSNALDRSTVLANKYADLLAELDPTLRSVVELLGEQGTSWQDLTGPQQRALVNLRQDNELYKALIPSQKAAVNALIAERDAWESLSPAQQQAAKATEGLTDRFDQFKEALEPRVLDLYSRSAGVLGSTLGPLTPLAEAAGDALSTVVDDIARGINSPGFTTGIDRLTRNAGPAIIATAHALGNLGSGLVGIFNAFAGNQGVLDGMVNATERFARFGQNLGQSERFQSFLAYVRETGPVVSQTLHDIADAGLSILQAVAPLGAPTLQFVGALADLLGFVARLPGGLGTTAVALALYGPLLLRLTNYAVGFSSAFNRAGNAVAGFGAGAGQFATNTGRAEQTASRTSRTLGVLGGAVKGLGVALPIAAVGFGIIQGAIAANEQRAEAAKRKFVDMFQAIEDGGAGARQAAADLAQVQDRLSSASFETRVAFEEARQEFDKQQSSMSVLDQLQQQVTRTQNDLTDAQQRYAKGAPELTAATTAYQVAQSNLKSAQDQLAFATMTATERIREQTLAVQAGADADLNYQQSVLSTKGAIDSYNAATASGKLTTDQLNQSLGAAKQATLSQGRAALNAAFQTNENADANAVLRGEYTKLRNQLSPNNDLAKFLDDLIAQLDEAARDRIARITVQVRGDKAFSGRLQATAIENAEGGLISGPGGPTDDRAGLFALSNGEYVLRAAAVKRIGVPVLDALNTGQSPELAAFDAGTRTAARVDAAPVVQQVTAAPAPGLTVHQVAAAVETGVASAMRAVLPAMRWNVDTLGIARAAEAGKLRKPGRR